MSLGDVLVAVLGAVLLTAALGGLVLVRLPDEEIDQAVPDVTSVDVRLSVGRVEISERDRATVRLRATVRRRVGRGRPRVAVVPGTAGGGELQVDGRGCEVRFRLELPRRTPVRAEVRRGEITLWGSDGDLMLVTEHGTVAGRELSGSRVRARSKTGDVTLHFSGPPREVSAVSDSGSVTVVLPDGHGSPYDVEVETANPVGATVELPGQLVTRGSAGGPVGAGRRVLARSRVGRVRVASSVVGPVKI